MIFASYCRYQLPSLLSSGRWVASALLAGAVGSVYAQSNVVVMELQVPGHPVAAVSAPPSPKLSAGTTPPLTELLSEGESLGLEHGEDYDAGFGSALSHVKDASVAAPFTLELATPRVIQGALERLDTSDLIYSYQEVAGAPFELRLVSPMAKGLSRKASIERGEAARTERVFAQKDSSISICGEDKCTLGSKAQKSRQTSYPEVSIAGGHSEDTTTQSMRQAATDSRLHVPVKQRSSFHAASLEVLQLEQPLAAKALLRSALRHDAADLPSRRLLGRLHFINGDYAALEQLLDAAPVAHQLDPSLKLLRAELALLRGQKSLSEEILARNSPAIEGNADYYRYWAALVFQRGDYEQSKILYQQLTSYFANDSKSLIGLAFSLKFLGDKKKAERVFNRALRADSLSKSARKLAISQLSELSK